MKRIWNALRYGDMETKKYIGSVIFFCVAAIGMLISAIVAGQVYLAVFGVLSGAVSFGISRTFSLVDDDFVAEINQNGEKDTVKSVVAAKKESDTAEPEREKRDFKGEGAAKSDESAGRRKREKQSQPDEEKEEIERFDHYDQQVMKKVKRKYRVKKDHRPIIVDYSKSYRIRECPAFIWRVHKKVFLLLLEKEPRKISISRDLIRNMGYKPGVRADQTKEYRAFQKKNLVTSVFAEYLPDYVDSGTKNDTLKSKNLYTIYPDICLSNHSAAEVMDLLCLNFMPQDKVTTSDKINGFFKRIYSAHILYRDKVYSITEYKEVVEKALREMCYAELSDREFVITLENLVKGRLISKEYADYYMEMKTRVVTRREEAARKRK